ncbi:O-antigen ligase family protein [Vibrio diabolicus]|uniref:O-antigen ligase family protein n=1 Tax=Vibrio diabolicus TaxID=50719 RepID=UPI00375243F1
MNINDQLKSYCIFLLLFLVIISPSLVSTPLNNFFAYIIIALVLLLSLLYANRIKLNSTCFIFGLAFVITPVFSLFNILHHQEWTLNSVLFGYFRFSILGVCFWSFYSFSSYFDSKSSFGIVKFLVLINLCVLIIGALFPAFNDALFYLYYNQQSYDEFYAYMVGRPGGLLGNPNTLAMTMVFLLLFFLQSEKISNRFFYISIIIFIVILTKSRTGLFGLFICLSFYFILMRRFSSFFYFTSIFCVVVILGLISGYFDVDSLIERYISGVNLSGREELWLNVVKNGFFLDNYLSGIFLIPSDFDAVDNEYLNILVKFGLLGSVLFLLAHLMLLFSVVKQYLSNKKNEKSVLSIICILLFLIFSIAGSPLTSIKLSFVYLIVLAFFINKSSEVTNESVNYGSGSFKV